MRPHNPPESPRGTVVSVASDDLVSPTTVQHPAPPQQSLPTVANGDGQPSSSSSRDDDTLRPPVSKVPTSASKKSSKVTETDAFGRSETAAKFPPFDGSTDDTDPAVLSTVRSVAHAARRKLHLNSIRTSAPGTFFNPTSIRVHVRWKDEEDGDSEGEKGAAKEQDGRLRIMNDRAFLWTSRDQRKGRNSIAVPASPGDHLGLSDHWQVHLSSNARRTGTGIVKMLFSFPYWDMGFWSGWSYTWGSVLFIFAGSWSYVDATYPGLENEGLVKWGSPLCFFFGALLYEVGAVMAYLEAVNDGSFQGSAMRRFLEGHEDEAKKLLDERVHNFFSRLTTGRSDDEESGYGTAEQPVQSSKRRGAIDLGPTEEGEVTTYTKWMWYPSWHCLKTHHVYEFGYLACSIQLFGATLYAIAGVVDLPGVFSTLQFWQELGAYWVPQIVASVGFLTAGIMFTIETQEKWWKPEPMALGWWSGFWAIIGSCGFLLCAIFGAISKDYTWAESQSDLSSTWGSFAYFLSGACQWYEAVNKRPLEEMLNERGEMKSYQVHPL